MKKIEDIFEYIYGRAIKYKRHNFHELLAKHRSMILMINEELPFSKITASYI